MPHTGAVTTRGRIVYTPPLPIALRGVGVGAVGLGVSVVAGVIVMSLDLPALFEVVAAIVLVPCAIVAGVMLAAGLLRIAGRGMRLVLDDDGFVNATGPGSGVRKAVWKDVRKVQTDGRFVSVDLAGGKRSLIRTASLEVEPKELAQQLRARLNTSHGYRPITPQPPSADPA